MFCQKCGVELNDDVNFCPKCGNKTDSKEETANTYSQYQETGRGSLILILGVFSFLFGLFLGIPAWIMGSGDLKKIQAGIIPTSEKTKTKVGMILGILNTFIIPIIIAFGIATVVGINVFTASSTHANRDAIIADSYTISSMAQQYYRKPAAMGGGGNSFLGWSIPSPLKQTANGKYRIEKQLSESLSLVGSGNEKGNDDVNPIKVELRVTHSEIKTTTIN